MPAPCKFSGELLESGDHSHISQPPWGRIPLRTIALHCCHLRRKHLLSFAGGKTRLVQRSLAEELARPVSRGSSFGFWRQFPNQHGGDGVDEPSSIDVATLRPRPSEDMGADSRCCCSAWSCHSCRGTCSQIFRRRFLAVRPSQRSGREKQAAHSAHMSEEPDAVHDPPSPSKQDHVKTSVGARALNQAVLDL